MKILYYCIFLLFATFTGVTQQSDKPVVITRGDSMKKTIFLIFSGDEFGDGAAVIQRTLKTKRVLASFFLTGNFYRNATYKTIVSKLADDGHYLGSHSDKHLLYCDWNNRDSLLLTRDEFITDLDNSYKELARWNRSKTSSQFFLPPYEWYNESIIAWTHQMGLQLINFTAGTRSTADYTFPEMGRRYVDSKTIYQSIIDAERSTENGLNGFILLIHIGTDPKRKDKFYLYLPRLIVELKAKGYKFAKIDELD